MCLCQIGDIRPGARGKIETDKTLEPNQCAWVRLETARLICIFGQTGCRLYLGEAGPQGRAWSVYLLQAECSEWVVVCLTCFVQLPLGLYTSRYQLGLSQGEEDKKN